MKQQLIFIFLFSSLLSFGQENGIYKGEKTQFLQCYLTINDSIAELEYFNEKGGQVFGHTPAIELKAGLESFKSKPIYLSQDNLIRVYKRKKHLLLKSKKHGNFKLNMTKMTEKDLERLRGRNVEFRNSHDQIVD